MLQYIVLLLDWYIWVQQPTWLTSIGLWPARPGPSTPCRSR